MHLRKSAVVNSHFLAYIALKLSISATTNLPGLDEQNRPELRTQQRTVHLYQNMLHSSTVVLKDQENTFVRFIKLREEIEHALQQDKVFPWALLTRLQAPKFFSDMVEALLGAIWLDSEGDYDVVRAVLVHLGILPILDRIIEHNVDVQHPVSRLSLWASREYKKVEFKYEKDKGKITCVIVIHHFEKGKKEEIGKPSVIMKVQTMYKGKRAEDEARFHAAEVAVKELEVKTIEQMIEEDILLELDIEEEEEEEEEEEAEERVE
jgi:endoribonuclease Dicer